MKKTLVLILLLSVMISCPIVYADEATDLQSLGLFKGTENGFELDAAATRVQTCVVLVRLLGKESKALTQNNPHPFIDVPAWASAYIGYL